ncbi:uncharacterized protein LOC126379667 [Pectinophora gossypiella]|uniref:uncharacterized protein LOC126379667 n=1 Tax=Pectinophora gossypiella TaxID=13191 RepID=UPI00214E3D6B|nr:uncharacterized protein LOC126379667 [Pectinophora gossypiella]
MTTCCSCKLVANELLAFLQCKIQVMDEVSLLQICETNFSEAEIDKAKNIIFEFTGHRYMNRKGDAKNKRNLQDILRLLHETDPDLLPSFVAKDLNRLPPITFDHVDVTSLLKDILVLKQSVSAIRSDFVQRPEVVEVKELLAEFRQELDQLRAPHEIIKYKKIAGESVAKSYKQVASQKIGTQSANCGTQAVCADARAPSLPLPPARLSRTSLDQTLQREERPLNCARSDDNFDTSLEKSFKTVVNGKKRRKAKKNISNKKGTAIIASSKIRIAPRLSYIYASRFHEDTTEKDISEFVSESGHHTQKVEKLPQFRRTSFASFKLTILQEQEATFLSESFWPSGVEYRKYIYRGPKSSTPAK